MPRGEAACACCARLDWLERRYKLSLFGEAPEPSAGANSGGLCAVDGDVKGSEGEPAGSEEEEEEEKSRGRQRLLQVRGECYLRDPEKVAELLAVDRYSKRWPLIPTQELEAPSVRHPRETSRRWLLHARRVPMLAEEDRQPGIPSEASVGKAAQNNGAPEPVASSPGTADREIECSRDPCARVMRYR